MEHISVYTEKKAKQLYKGPKFVRWAVMLGIVIILNVFFLVARGVIFPQPQYENYCQPTMPTPADKPASQMAPISNDFSKCDQAYQAAQTDYQTKSFIFLVGLGLLSLIVGVLPIGSSIVSTGLSYGGVLVFVISSIMYWHDATQLIQLGISGIALAALIYIGIKRFHD